MIRVGQMALAQMMKRHLRVESQEQMGPIIELFSDVDKEQPFSIHSISKAARREFGLLPGDWFNPSQIAHVLACLQQRHLQAKNRLNLVVFNSGNLFFDQLLEAMMAGREVADCKCKLGNKLICDRCNQASMAVGAVVLTRIGLEAPEEKYLSVLADMMELKQFQGMIGGRPKKALYFLGTYNRDHYIYLDPHYVQQAEADSSAHQ